MSATSAISGKPAPTSIGLIGSHPGRVEDPALLRGEGRFIDDLRLPGMLHAALVRSSYAHARIRGIETSAARSFPGVHAILTIDDLRPHLRYERLVVGLPSGSYLQAVDRPVLADGEVVHVGEAVAVVIADDRYLAEDAAQLVEVDYEPLPVVADPRSALTSESPTAHAGAPHNLLAEFEVGYGDVDTAIARAPHLFREILWQHRGGGHSIECRGGLAVLDSLEDRLTLWSSTQTPHAAMRALARMLGRDEGRVRVATPDVGGGFGPKLVFYPEDVVICVAALICARPVKWIEDRREHFLAATQERDQYWDVEIAVDDEARILGIRGGLIHDHGAYTARGVNLPYESALTVTLPYDVPAYRMRVEVALTNKVPVTPVRGAGQPQGVFAMERLLDRVARELGLDRAEVRRRNLVPASRMPCQKPLEHRGGMPVVLDSGDYLRCQADALRLAGWSAFAARKREARAGGRYLGMGLANFVKGTGRGPFESVEVRVDSSGRISVRSGAAAMGQSTATMLAQVVGDRLGGDIANISVTTGDTAAIALGIGGFNSRQMVAAGTSAHAAAEKVRRKAFEVASSLLEASVADLEIEGQMVRVRGVPGLEVGLGEIAKAAAGTPGYALPAGIEPGLEAIEHVVSNKMPFANGSAVAEVEVDVDTGEVSIRRLVVVHDCGRMVNPVIVDGQVVGGIVHGIGNALYEWMGYDEQAQPVTTNLGEYLLVTAPQVPDLVVAHVESPSPLNPLGVKGVGESGVLAAIPAVASAVEDALSPFAVHVDRVPISPAYLLDSIGRASANPDSGREASGPSRWQP